MAHLIQVGAGSGGMPVLDLVCRDPRITRVTLIEPDIYKPHNLERHLFPSAEIGQPKAEAAQRWLVDRRPDVQVDVICTDLLAEAAQADIDRAVASATIGVCAADNELAKYHWDLLMRRHSKPWTLGEVLSGGIGGFVHWFTPGGPCYGCVASHLKRAVTVDRPKAPDYSQPGGPIEEAAIPASMAAIHAIASLHALVTLDLMEQGPAFDPGFSSLLFALRRVPDVFEEALRPYKFRISRLADCLICGTRTDFAASTPEELDVALDQALARLDRE
jgi:molybdopterin/thiamine biosynthesis adenylyltransferase